MNSKYQKILRRIEKGPLPIEFHDDEAIFVDELINGGYVTGSSCPSEEGVAVAATATGLSFEGRCALEESSFWGRVRRLYDLLIGVIIGVVIGVATTIISTMLLNHIPK